MSGRKSWEVASVLNEAEKVYDETVKEYSQEIHSNTDIVEQLKEKSKFDEEVVFTGSRFRFELEFLSQEPKSDSSWQKILERLNDPLLRFGSGGTKGLGH